MNAVLYYSNTNESLHIARHFMKLLQFEGYNIASLENFTFHHLLIVFPVHSQNIPYEVKKQFKRIRADKIVLVATYGKMSYGRVLLESQKILRGKVVGAAYIPTKHAYIRDDKPFDEYHLLDRLKECFRNEREVIIPKTRKNIFANFFINLRSRIGIKIIKNADCNKCNQCHQRCKAIYEGKTNRKCNRCMNCLENCPKMALSFKLDIFMKIYLRKPRCNRFVFYIDNDDCNREVKKSISAI